MLERIREHASERPDAIALRDELGTLSYAELPGEIEHLTDTLAGERVGLLLDNGNHWACLDLALLHRQAVCVPMPTFFTDEQLHHLVRDAGLDTVYTDNPERMDALAGSAHQGHLRIAGRRVDAFRIPGQATGNGKADGTAKVTYTSGTTGQPKGVRLSEAAMLTVTRSLCDAIHANASDRSLSLLPLSILLGNIAGLYAPLMVGATANIPSLAGSGIDGSSGLRIERLFETLNRTAPTTTVLVPQLLKALLGGIGAGLSVPDSLRFIAVGGAPVPESVDGPALEVGGTSGSVWVRSPPGAPF